MVNKITVEELKNRLNKNTICLIDVREPGENQTECIADARLIPLGSIDLKKLPSEYSSIAIHCQSGRRSLDACERLLKANPLLDIYNVEGGILAWKAAGFETAKGKRTVLSLDRQTQIAIGALIFLFTLLGSFLTPAFYLIPAFIGLGLIYAGISGTCYFSKLLAKLPWNQAKT